MITGALRPRVIALLGPTASGKSALAAALAKRIPVEIVSVDSAQVYRGMDIGTAKPDAEERAAIPHHLLDLLDPDESYSAARFCGDAGAAVAGIVGRGRTPLLVGGTMLYFKALREGLSDLPPADPSVRAEIEARAAIEGWPALHRELAAVDPATAMRLPPNDSQRISRALEIFRQTGAPMSHRLGRRQEPAPWEMLQIALMPADRSRLHENIARRFDAMLAAGFVEELVGLRNRFRLAGTMPSMRCVGYRQIWEMLEGRLPKSELRDRGIFATRQLAKRQLTWLRSWPDIHPVDSLADDALERVLKLITGHGIHG